MRGTRERALTALDHDRIIPADAGNTGAGPGEWSWTRDHPRGCGEHWFGSLALNAHRGSSPRMRGTHGLGTPLGLNTGIIPADAGNTGPLPALPRVSWDHPRGCGEHDDTPGLYIWLHGSSPRMRGTRGTAVATERCHGIIPADAGNT